MRKTAWQVGLRPIGPTALALLVACGGAPPAATSTEGERAEAVGAAEALPSAALEQLAWLLEILNTGPASAETLATRFHPDFLEQVPAEDLAAGLLPLNLQAPFTVRNAEPSPEGTQLRAVLDGQTGPPLQVWLAVSPAPPHLIQGLALRPAHYLIEDLPATWPAIEAELRELAPSVSLLGAELGGDSCRPLYAVDADRPLAVGSTFKLYVLGALVTAVEEGLVSWDDVLPLDPDWRVITSPALAGLPDGERLTLRDYALDMISVSDNTATDHLLYHLGRERVEAIQAEMGHAHPELNIPMLSTRDLIHFKILFTPAQRESYLAAGADERRAQLEATGPLDMAMASWGALLWTSPRYLEIEWLESAQDLCRAMLALGNMSGSEAGGPIRDILSANPGMTFDRERWTWVGYKGGSEPGVASLTWLLRRNDDRWFVLTTTINDPTQPVDIERLLRVDAAAVNRLADAD